MDPLLTPPVHSSSPTPRPPLPRGKNQKILGGTRRVRHHNNSPIQDGLRDGVGVAVRPARVLEDARRAAVLLEVLVRDTSHEDRFAVVGVRLDGRHGSGRAQRSEAYGGGALGGPGQEGAGGGGGC